jgi:hypothetical protein
MNYEGTSANMGESSMELPSWPLEALSNELVLMEENSFMSLTPLGDSLNDILAVRGSSTQGRAHSSAQH